jgi:hypothetical protein
LKTAPIKDSPKRSRRGLLIAAVLLTSIAPLDAQGQQNFDKLKVDTRNAVGVIGADKHKTQIYCQILELERQQADQENNKNKKTKKREHKNKAEALSHKIDQLQKQLGPELVTLDNTLKNLDLSSPDGREIALIIQTLNESCPE